MASTGLREPARDVEPDREAFGAFRASASACLRACAAFLLELGGPLRGLAGGGVLRGAGLQQLVRGLTVDGRAVARLAGRRRDGRVEHLLRRRVHRGLGRAHARPGDRGRRALLVEQGDDGLAGAERLQQPLEVVRRGGKGAGGGAQGLRVVGREGAQRVLHPVAELGEHVGRHVLGGLGDEEDAHALAADEPHRLDHLLQEVLRRAREQQVRLVEEEHQPRLVGVAHLGQLLEQLRQQPHEERGEQRGAVLHAGQLEGGDQPAPVRRGAQQVGGLERRLAEEHVAALGLQPHDLAQDDAGGGGRDAADALELLLALVGGEVRDGGLQVLEVEQRELLRVGPVEDQLQAGGLRRVEAEHLAQEQRAEVGDGRADRHARAQAAQRVELHRVRRRRPRLPDARRPLGDPGVVRALDGQPGQVALDVGEEHRDALRRQALRHALQGLRLAGARGARDQPVAVERGQREADLHGRVGNRVAAQRTGQQGSERQRRGVGGVARAYLVGVRRRRRGCGVGRRGLRVLRWGRRVGGRDIGLPGGLWRLPARGLRRLERRPGGRCLGLRRLGGGLCGGRSQSGEVGVVGGRCPLGHGPHASAARDQVRDEQQDHG